AGSVPILGLLMLLGGIAWEQIVDAALVLFTTALAAGSVGSLIALWRERTFQSLALTVLALVLYLCLVRALALVPGERSTMETVQTWCDPFLALGQVLDPPAPRWPSVTLDDAGLAPAHGFALVMGSWTLLLNAFALWKLRVWNPSGEPIIQPEHVIAAQ